MKIAVAGKGGSGKTTISGTLARVLAERGESVLAIDGDTNPNLGLSLGVPRDRLPGITPLPNSILQRVTDEHGKSKSVFTSSIEDLKSQYGVRLTPKLTLLLMGRVDHAGAG